ncbi:MAG: preprotein translocase subunit SecG [candidate division TM6 bacterium GW2011_GWE2_41_16]|nr:MAG: preprotein translocase subunit SecG [candidate division TM6 bacterium GW2011_GWE2_41_16]
MLYQLLVTLFIIISLLLILLILIQKSKGSMGLGSMGGGSQMLFGGSSGQDFLQKATWILAACWLALSIGAALVRTNLEQTSRYVTTTSQPASVPVEAPAAAQPVEQNQAPQEAPVSQPTESTQTPA